MRPAPPEPNTPNHGRTQKYRALVPARDEPEVLKEPHIIEVEVPAPQTASRQLMLASLGAGVFFVVDILVRVFS